MADAEQSDWRPIGAVDLARLREARHSAHFAVQWLGRAARAFVPPQPDDAHTNLGWDRTADGFATHALRDTIDVCLNLPELMLLVGNGRTATFPLDGRADADARRWLGDTLGRAGFEAGMLDAPLPYAMPSHALRTGAAYRADRAALTELAAWYANADASLSRLRQTHAPAVAEASQVRCWPHHFDLATLFSLRGEPARHIGAGLSPGDEHYDEPYFYVNLWPRPDASRLPPLDGIGHWHNWDFTAAVATASDILNAPDRQAASEGFLRDAVAAAMRAMG
jgi:hypothetical protein